MHTEHTAPITHHTHQSKQDIRDTHQFIWQTIILTEVVHGGVLVGLDGVRNVDFRHLQQPQDDL